MNNVQLFTTHHPRSSFKVKACIFRPRISLVLNSGRVRHIFLSKAYHNNVTEDAVDFLKVQCPVSEKLLTKMQCWDAIEHHVNQGSKNDVLTLLP